MNPPLAFISYDVKLNDAERVRFTEEAAACTTKFQVQDSSVQRVSSREESDKSLRGKIGRCDFMIVLLSRGMDTGPIEFEVVQAKRANVPYFGVYLSTEDAGMELPEGLPANRSIPWDWDRIAAAVSQVLKEGKHHVFA